MYKFTISYNLNDERIIPFLMEDNRASIYHHPAWLKAISKTFNHQSFYLLIEDNNNHLLGLIPFVKIKSIIEGKEIVSVPFSAHCQLLVPEEIITSLFNFLNTEFGDHFKIKFRTFGEFNHKLTEFSHCPAHYVQQLNLIKDLNDLFDSFHPRSVRGSIRRSHKNNLTIYKTSLEPELKIFYDLEFSLRKRLFLPVLPYALFKNMLEELKNAELIKIYVVKKDSFHIAAAFVLNFKDTYYIEYAASDKNYINLYPNHQLYWEIIKDAHSNGATKVDFGRTSFDNESLALFKEKWGAQKKIVYFSNFPPNKFNSINTSKLKNKLTKINSHLPDWVLKKEGDIIYRHLD